MKKNRMIFAALSLALAAWGAPHLNADTKDKDGGAQEEHGKRGGEGMLKEKLGLSDAQVAQLKEARKADQEAMKPLMEKMKTDVDTLRLLVDKKASDKELSAQLDTLKADKKAVEDQQQKQRDAMGAGLTPLQKAKFVINMADHMKGGMGEHEGWGGRGHGHEDGDKPGHGPDDKGGDK